MTLSQRLEKIKDNWVAIVISLLAAVFLYYFYQVTQLSSATFSVPLKVESNGNMLMVNNAPENIKITVKGNPEDISKLTEKDISAYINLDYYYKSGNYNVPIDIKLSKTAENINPLEIRKKPENISIKLEEKAIEYVPVLVRTIGEPEAGYEITEITTEPKNVRIIGPSSAVTQVSNIETDVIDISGIKTDSNFSTDFVNINSLITIDEENICTVNIKVSEILNEKTFSDVNITLLSPNEKLDATIENNKASITIQGAQNYLANYNLPYGVLYVDCSSITEPGEYELKINNHKLSNIKTLKITPETVKVYVSLKSEEDSVEQMENSTENTDKPMENLQQ